MNNETDDNLEEKYNSCVNTLESKKDHERNHEDIKNIQTYLNTLLYFRRLKLYDPINVNNTVRNISQVIKYVSIPKNNYVLKLGQKGNAFYLILKGKVSIMVVEYKKVYLTIEDYLIFLLKLFYFKEKELLKETIILNKSKYMIEENFEIFIKNLYNEQKTYEKEIKKEDKKDNFNNIKKENRNIFTGNLIKMIEKIFPELISLEKKNKNEKDNTYLDYIFNNNFKENEVNPDKLISLINIDNYSLYEKYLHKPFSIPFYFQINILERGKYFGHTALETNSKGSLTIITLQDSSFGIIEKNDYFRLLSKINKELDSNFYSTLYSLPFFHNISKSVFQRFYSSFFEYHLYKRNTILYEMKKKTNLLYLIKNGKFSIYIKGNMLDVYDILIYLQKEKNKKMNKKGLSEEDYNFKHKIIEKDEKDELIYNKSYKTKEFNDAVYAKNDIYLGSFEGSHLIGLVDFVDKKNDIALFNIKIESNFCELYEITKKNFNVLISDYSSVNDIIEEYELKKLNLMINKITAYKKLFFSSIDKKENENISLRINLKKKEKETAILNKTQKALKIERLKKNIYLTLHNDKIGKPNYYKFNLNRYVNNRFNSIKNLENKPFKKNNSEKKRITILKEKLLEKHNKELFLLDNGDVNYKNKILKMKKHFLSKQNSKKRLSIQRELISKNTSNNTDNNSINNNNMNYILTDNSINNNNMNYILTDNCFIDKIKQALYYNKLNTPINQPLRTKLNNEKKLLYINMFMNGKNSSKKLLVKNRNENNSNNFNRKVNKSVGTTMNKLNYLSINLKKNDENLDNKEIKIENYFLDNKKIKENVNKVKRKIEEYKQREKNIINKLKIDIQKLQNYMSSTNIYSLNRQKFLETQKELHSKQIYDEDYIV